MTLPPFQLLVDAHWHDVARWAAALAPPGEAQDVSQQAWTQAYSAYPRLRSADNLRSWLLTITHRAAMDAHRARSRRPDPVSEVPEPTPMTTRSARSAASSLAGSPLSTVSSLSSISSISPVDPLALAVDADPALWDAVAGLPVRQREALALRYVCDLDHATVAALLQTTPGATRRLVSDGLATLRRALAPPLLTSSTSDSSPPGSPADARPEDRS